MTARDLHAWLRSLHPVAEPSVDKIIVGDPNTIVRGIAVMWMPTWAALREAMAQGCNVVVAHEPTFFMHHDLEGFDAAFAEVPPRARASLDATRDAKRRWIEENGMVVIRCHDALDAMPGGVVDCLARGLGFGAAEVVTAWQRYRVVRLPEPMPASAVAARLAGGLNRWASRGSRSMAIRSDRCRPSASARAMGASRGVLWSWARTWA